MSPRAPAAPGNACTTTGPIPNRVVLTTTDSNAWGGSSGHTYTFTARARRDDRRGRWSTVREGKNLKGRFLGVVLGTVGKRVLGKAFENSVKAIEARNAAPTAPAQAA